MDDEAYVAELLVILTNPASTGIDPDDPYGAAADGIDRYDGFGRDVMVTALSVVPGEHGDDLVVTFELVLPAGDVWAHLPRTGTVVLEFDAEWRRLSEYDTPGSYAPKVAYETAKAGRAHLAAHHGSAPDLERYPVKLPTREAQWDLLLSSLRHEGPVREVGPGRFEVELQSDGAGPVVLTVVITPDEWEQVLEREYDHLDDLISETLASRDDDERFLVVYRGRLEKSTREALPPVRGRALARRLAAMRSEKPNATFGWFAYAPGEERDGPREPA